METALERDGGEVEALYVTAEIPDYWEEDEDFPAADWRHEVEDDNTRLGYWEWVAAQRASKDDD